MDILLSNSSGVPLYKQIARQVKEQVLSGALQEGEMLPSIRQLAKDLRVSVITTKRAYEELEQAGFINTIMGKGCFVAAPDTRRLQEEHRAEAEELLLKTIELAKLGGIPPGELKQLLEQFYKEDN